MPNGMQNSLPSTTFAASQRCSCSVMDDRSAADRAFRRQALCAIGSARRCAMKHVDDRIMPAHRLVDAPKAPRPPGPFSHATVVGPWVYVSGMGGLDPKTGEVISDDLIEQTHQTIVNLEAILAAAACTLQHVVKATVYLTDMADYPRVNKVYDEAFAPNKRTHLRGRVRAARARAHEN